MKVILTQSCLICKYLQVIYVVDSALNNKGQYTCSAETPVYGSVKLDSYCKLFELNPEIIRCEL